MSKMEPSRSASPDVPLMDWILYEYNSMKQLAQIFIDDIDTVIKRRIDGNKNVLDQHNNPLSKRLAKEVVEQLCQRQKKLTEDLEVSSEKMFEHLRQRFSSQDEELVPPNNNSEATRDQNRESDAVPGNYVEGSDLEDGDDEDEVERDIGNCSTEDSSELSITVSTEATTAEHPEEKRKKKKKVRHGKQLRLRVDAPGNAQSSDSENDSETDMFPPTPVKNKNTRTRENETGSVHDASTDSLSDISDEEGTEMVDPLADPLGDSMSDPMDDVIPEQEDDDLRSISQQGNEGEQEILAPPSPTETVIMSRGPPSPAETVIMSQGPPSPTETVIMSRGPHSPAETVIMSRAKSIKKEKVSRKFEELANDATTTASTPESSSPVKDTETENPISVKRERISSNSAAIKPTQHVAHIIDDERPGTSKKLVREMAREKRAADKLNSSGSESNKSTRKLRNPKQDDSKVDDLEALNQLLASSDEDGDSLSVKSTDNTKTRVHKGKRTVQKKSEVSISIQDDEKLNSYPDFPKVKIEKMSGELNAYLEKHTTICEMSTDDNDSDEEAQQQRRLRHCINNLLEVSSGKKSTKGKNTKTSRGKAKRGRSKKRSRNSDESQDLSTDDDGEGFRGTYSKRRVLSSSEEENDSDSRDISGIRDKAALASLLSDEHEEDTEVIISDSEDDKSTTSTIKNKSSQKQGKSNKSYYTPHVRLSDSDDDDRESRSKKRRLNAVESSSDSEKEYSTKKRRRKAYTSSSGEEFVLSAKSKSVRKPRRGRGSSNHDSSSDDSEPTVLRTRKRVTRSGNKTRRSDDETSMKKSRKKTRLRKMSSSSSDDQANARKKDESDSDIQEIEVIEAEAKDSQQKGRRSIREIRSGKDLEKSTREAEKEEEERKKRVSERQKLFNEFERDSSSTIETAATEELVLDIEPQTKVPIVQVDKSIVTKLKSHQVKGVKFLYDTTIESVEQSKRENAGGGCILAHCMGLGKTLQTIAYLHSVLSNPHLNFKTALVLCPLNTVGNWYDECRKWLEDVDVRVSIHRLWDGKNYVAKAEALEWWMNKGGVGIMHYDLMRKLSAPETIKNMKANMRERLKKSLLEPGPDIVVCDEGHLLKNAKSKLSLAVSKLSTRRRIVLTGTPLQNNLEEYHTMMSFVKPNLLGTKAEFKNRFMNPISNGQHADSNDQDVKLMKRRAHVLHKLLDGCVQRLDYTVLTPYLPPKYEYVILVNMTKKQDELYLHYLNVVKHVALRNDPRALGRQLLSHYAMLCKIWTHPVVLSKNKDNDDDDFIDNDSFIDDDTTSSTSSVSRKSDEDSDSDIDWLDQFEQKIKKRVKVKEEKKDADEPEKKEEEVVTELTDDWYLKFFAKKRDMYPPQLSGKLMLLQEILKISESIGDKVLVFSQYLTSLNLIEEFLLDWDREAENAARNKENILNVNTSENRWRKGMEYFRIDGAVQSDDRHKLTAKFNKQTGLSRAKLFLISTKAGGLGINLFGANRVVIFDVSWNPSQDMQSIFRVYRFGQNKPCYIYRLVSSGTMEEKIYNRQVVKLSLSGRVIDEHQIERHFRYDDVKELYKYDPKEKAERPIPPVPKDRLLAELMSSFKEQIDTYFEHDSLLQNKENEELTDEERRAAWDEYRAEKNRIPAENPQQKVRNDLKQKWTLTYPQILPSSFDSLASSCAAHAINLRARHTMIMTMPENDTRNSLLTTLNEEYNRLKFQVENPLQYITPTPRPPPNVVTNVGGVAMRNGQVLNTTGVQASMAQAMENVGYRTDNTHNTSRAPGPTRYPGN